MDKIKITRYNSKGKKLSEATETLNTAAYGPVHALFMNYDVEKVTLTYKHGTKAKYRRMMDTVADPDPYTKLMEDTADEPLED